MILVTLFYTQIKYSISFTELNYEHKYNRYYILTLISINNNINIISIRLINHTDF